MSSIPTTFSALVAQKDGDAVVREVRQISVDELGEGDTVIRVTWSCVNYKDGLATSGQGQGGPHRPDHPRCRPRG